MAATQSDIATDSKGARGRYLFIGLGGLFTVLLIASLVYFREEIQDVGAYGYGGGFLVNILGGVTIVPVPSLAVTFTLGHILNPVYVGLMAGLGEAVGGLTIYLTGAGGGTIWSKLRAKQQAVHNQTGTDGVPLVTVRVESRQQAFFTRIVRPMRRWGSFWPVFLASAMIFSPFYFVGLGAGALGMGLRKFFLISWAGKTVKGLYVAFAGYWGLFFILRWLGG